MPVTRHTSRRALHARVPRSTRPRGSTRAYAATSTIAGKGLFARRYLRRGELVVAMTRPVRQAPALYDRATRQTALPHDRGLYIAREDVYVTDWSLATAPKPLWHFMNHAVPPNVRATLGGGGVRFVAARNIAAGEELVLNYGESVGLS